MNDNKGSDRGDLGFAPGNKNTVAKAIIDQGLNADANYTSADKISVDWCKWRILKILYTTPDTLTSVGGVTTQSIKYDRVSIGKRLNELSDDLGITDKRSKANVLNLW